MYDDFIALIDELKADQNYPVSDRMNAIADQYGVCHRTLYSRFNSYFGESPKKYVRKLLTPSKQELDSLILNSESPEHLWEKLPYNGLYWRGIFDRVYGGSTFFKAKQAILESQATSPYTVSRDDNRSLIYSQLLGDGSYDAQRHTLRVAHGIKQAEYLRWKVGMITKGYPNLSSRVTVLTHTQGHQYASWYSGKLGNLDLPSTRADCWVLVEKLSPLGWLVWYLDDGCGSAQNYTISICSEKTEIEAVRVLQTYGIKARRHAGSIFMRGAHEDKKFSKAFIEPFIHLIPPSMQYKVKI